MNNLRNLIIIGSGPAAWTAAIYAARAKLNPLVLAGEQSGGQLMNTALVENFPGFPEGVLGPELMSRMRKQAEKLGVEVLDKNVTAIKQVNRNSLTVNCKQKNTEFELRIADNDLRITRTVIVATGAIANTLKLPGEKKLMGRGVGVCAVCDAPFYKDAERVFVIGGGDSAIEEAMALAKYAKEVIILVRKSKMRAAAMMQDHIKQSRNIKIWYKTEVREFIGEKNLQQVKIVKEGKESLCSANGVFYAIGHVPATQFLAGSSIKLDDKGYILIKGGENHTTTNIPGVFATGDCVDSVYRQAIVAAGMGCMAALDAQKWLENQGKC